MGVYGNGNEKKSKGKQHAPPQFRFISHSLTADQKESLGLMDISAEFPDSLLDDLVGEGYKYSLSFDEKNQTFIASLTDRAKGSTFENACLTGRGSTPANARASLLFRHVHLAQGDWTALDNGSDKGRSDFG